MSHLTLELTGALSTLLMRGKLMARPVQRLVGRVVASTRAICLRQAIELLTGDFRKYYSLKKLVAQWKQVLRESSDVRVIGKLYLNSRILSGRVRTQIAFEVEIRKLT